jgi:type III pantothenate kinase
LQIHFYDHYFLVMNLTVDQGNTFTKIALFDGETLVNVVNNVPNNDIVRQINGFSPSHCIISSVGNRADLYVKDIDPQTQYVVFDHNTPVPVKNLYETPETLGMDRLAGAIGSKKFKPDGNNLVIDCGTCITYDLIDDQNQYQGGSISPGLEIRLRALNNFTANLPLIKIEDTVELVGKSTKAAILSGVAHGTVCEIEGMIDKYMQQYTGLSVFLCGGSAKYFENKIRGTIFVTPELVLYGLNKILRYNVKNS